MHLRITWIAGIMIKEQKEADEFLLSLWALNDKYPDYVGCVRFDGASTAFHDIDECKKFFQAKVNQKIDEKISSINKNIELAQENGQDVTDLLAQRKAVRSYGSLDISSVLTIDELINLYPKDL